MGWNRFTGLSGCRPQPALSELRECCTHGSSLFFICGVSPYTSAAWYPAKESGRPLYRFLGLFVWVALCSAPTIPATSVSLNAGMSPELSETSVVPCLVSPSQCYHPEKTLRSKLKQSQISPCFPSLSDHTVRPHHPTAASHFTYFMQFSCCLWQIQSLGRCPIASGTNYQYQVLRHGQKLKLRLF